MTTQTAHGRTTGTDVVVARQPIVDRRGDVHAFELLYRSMPGTVRAADGDQMTADVLLGALTIGLDELVGPHRVFCNATRGTLTGDVPITLPPSRTVVEVLESVALDDAVLAACRDLVARGYRLALDDFVWVPGAEEALALASYVKIDVLAQDWAETAALAARCAEHDVVLLAEKVETEQDVRRAADLGFELFQGFAIDHPTTARGRTVSTSALARAQLAATVLTEDLDLVELEQVLRREPGLVVQLLNLASIGSHHGMRRTVRTVREALVLLGSERTRQWLALTLLGASRSGPSPDALATALVRARTCELAAAASSTVDPEEAFTAGLLSALDLLLGVPTEELVQTLDVDARLKAAAFEQRDAVGRLVAAVVAHERGRLRPGGDVPGGTDLAHWSASAFAWALPYLGTLAA